MAQFVNSEFIGLHERATALIGEVRTFAGRLHEKLSDCVQKAQDEVMCAGIMRDIDSFRQLADSIEASIEQLAGELNGGIVPALRIEAETQRIKARAAAMLELFSDIEKKLNSFEYGTSLCDDSDLLKDHTKELHLVCQELVNRLHDIINCSSYAESSAADPDFSAPGGGVSFGGSSSSISGAAADCAPLPQPDYADINISFGYDIDMDFGSGIDGGYGDAMSEPMPMPMPMPMPAPPQCSQIPSAPIAAGRAETSQKAVKVKPTRVDSVAFSVLSPERVKAGEYSDVDVYMYTKSQRKIIEKAIKQAEHAVRETGKGGFDVSRGTEVTVILTSDDVTITDEVDTGTWNGESIRFDFQFFVPEDYARKQIAFTCQVLFGGIQITRLHFTVRVSDGTAARVPVRVKRKDCRKAFVSYSHKDEKRVLSQLSAIAQVAPRLVFWLDSQSLDNGDNWRKEIQRAIRNADVFLLFWSVYARQSEEVEKEWSYALKKKGLRFILPVPLDPPANCPPPEKLGRLHFGHRSLAYTDEMDGLSFAGSKQFRKIR